MKTIPKKYECEDCGNKQYTDDFCFKCGRVTTFIPIKQELINPIGIVPKKIWLEHRKQDVKQAIIRYLEADLTPPNEWYEELEDLIRRT